MYSSSLKIVPFISLMYIQTLCPSAGAGMYSTAPQSKSTIVVASLLVQSDLSVIPLPSWARVHLPSPLSLKQFVFPVIHFKALNSCWILSIKMKELLLKVSIYILLAHLKSANHVPLLPYFQTIALCRLLI